ncbi:IclR family transcriptional regulator [Profundibacterium mesophilum]|uniref:Transcriptional regulator IclR family protein n=1 Tax=Profundibacterium mesophilum KAUST100406-0324 TaxID=1037889 RepID=A0A921NTQ3_9RHOB|nr:IclR family transcriptional regulator [Profundibacterium mesophilum]KAF0674574.1 Transcriptional regulator IclR family protein [Profundibacterium mesophilum KAUST100406-0324]
MSAVAGKGDGTIGKALSVLDQVAALGRPVRFSELVPHSPFPKATLYRFLQSLVSQGMLAHDPERGVYTLGLRLVRLAHSAWSTASLAPVARPHLDQLSAKVGETVHLAQLDHAQVLYVDKRNAGIPVEMYSQAGKVGPAYCTGVGKAMLAFLPPDMLDGVLSQQSYHPFTHSTLTGAAELRAALARIKERGHAFDREEHEPGIICVAVPILSREGRVLGAVSITGSTERTGLAALERFVPALRAAATAIAEDAGNWQFPDAAPQIISKTG